MELFKHQVEGIEFLKGKNPIGGRSFILADKMGLGKTRQSIIAVKEGGSLGTLIVCPASLKINWQREIEMVYPGDEIRIMKSGEMPIDGKWFIVNYDILERNMAGIEAMIEMKMFNSLILDEAQYIKGESLRSKAIIGGKKKKKSGEVVKFDGLAKFMDVVLPLTGTPIMNRPIELYPILKAVGHPLGKSKIAFAKQFCEMFWMYRIRSKNTGRSFVTTEGKYYQFYSMKPEFEIINRWPDYSGATNLDELRRQLKGWIIMRKKEDVLDLPEKIISIRESVMDKEWRKEYENAWENYIAFREQNPIEGWDKDNVIMAKHLVEIGKLKQVCSLSKIENITNDIVDAVDQGEKVIVFSQYTKTIDAICDKMQEMGIGVTALTGSCDMVYRQASVDSFQNDESVKVFVANIKAGGVGINLTAGSIVIFADMEWSPEIHKQAEDRAHRIGQKGTVNVYYYVAPETIEDDIIDILNKKKNIADQILEGNKRRLSKTSVGSEFLKRMMAGEKKLDITND